MKRVTEKYNDHLQVLPEKFEYQVKVILFWQLNIKDKTNTFYLAIACKLTYLQQFLVVTDFHLILCNNLIF